MRVETTFEIGEMVLIKHDPDKLKRMVTSFSVRGSGLHSYCLSCGEKETWHYEYEIEKPTGEEKKAGFNR